MIWIPGLLQVLRGRTDISTAGLYFVAALILAWIGTGVVAGITNRYQRTLHGVERAKHQIAVMERRAELKAKREEEDEQHRRRKNDNS